MKIRNFITIILAVFILLSLFSCKYNPNSDDIETAIPSIQDLAGTENESASDEQIKTDDTNEITEEIQKTEETHKTEEIKNTEQSEKQDTQQPEKSEVEQDTEKSEESEEKKSIANVIDGYYVPSTVTQMIAESTLIAVCDYIQPIDYIKTDKGDIYTEHKMKVIDILRGETDNGEIIVRTAGGKIDDEVWIYRNEPEFTKDCRYLLFLSNPGLSKIGNTEGDHYYVVGREQGVMKSGSGNTVTSKPYKPTLKFEVPENSEIYTPLVNSIYNLELVTMDNLDVNIIDSAIILDEFKTMMAKLNTSIPINPNYAREESLKEYKSMLNEGRISETEYAEYTKENTEYAKIVKRVEIK